MKEHLLLPEEQLQEASNKGNKKLIKMMIKLVIILTIYITWILCKIFYIKDDNGYVNPLYDFKDNFMIIVLKGFTDYLSQILQLRDIILIFASLALDFLFFFTIINFICYGNSSKFPFGFLIFFLFRSAVVQNLFVLKMYDTYLFDFPGFYSICVPLYPANDFFYSGHIGTCLLLSFYVRDNVKYKLPFFIACVIIMIETIVMITLRAHYSIDIIFGFIAAHYFFINVHIFSEFFDTRVGFFGRPKKSIETRKIKKIYDQLENDFATKV